MTPPHNSCCKADLSDGKLLTSQLPDLAVTEYLGEAANETAMIALVGQSGDWVNRTDDGRVYVVTGTDSSIASNWTALSYPASSATDLAYDATNNTVTSSTGSDAVPTVAVAGGNDGLMSGSDKTKLDGIEVGATGDQTDERSRFL